MQKVLEVKNCSKSFGTFEALKDAKIVTYSGQVTVLLGENGAGKSTLMKIVSGQLKPTSGEIYFLDKKVQIKNVKHAQKLGIAIVNQEIQLIPDLNVTANIFLGREITNRLGIVQSQKMHQLVKKMLQKWKVNFDSDSLVANLTIAQQQLIEIIKALSLGAQLLILDEPTSSLSDSEAKLLFAIIAELKKTNVSILYITHRMEEISLIADHVAIFRDGTFVDQFTIDKFDLDLAIEKMVGKKINDKFPAKVQLPALPYLEIKNFSNDHTKNLNLKINKSEILVIAGLVGSGRSEIFKSLVGLLPYSKGIITLDGIHLKNKRNDRALKNGFFYVSEDRKLEGLLLNKSIDFNITLASLEKICYPHSYFLNLQKEKVWAKHYIKKIKIKTLDGSEKVSNLSGGNQQKVAIAKALMTNANVYIFDEPTRGVDVAARKEIYQIFNRLKRANKAIVIISSDLQEVVGIADRVIVFNRQGLLSGILNQEAINGQKILKLAFQERGFSA